MIQLRFKEKSGQCYATFYVPEMNYARYFQNNGEQVFNYFTLP